MTHVLAGLSELVASTALEAVGRIKAEYLYVDLERFSATSTNLTAFTPAAFFRQTCFSHSVDLKSNIAGVGVNYHFN